MRTHLKKLKIEILVLKSFAESAFCHCVVLKLRTLNQMWLDVIEVGTVEMFELAECW